MLVRVATEADRAALLDVNRIAFGEEDEAELVDLMHDDPTAAPLISLVAEDEGALIGHVLFSRAEIDGAGDVLATILAPLCVIPGRQRSGVGGALVRRGLELAKEAGAELVFVLGHPSYYPRHGFRPAGAQGLQAPHPIPEEHADAWMVLALNEGALDRAEGTVRVSEVLGRPEYWVE